MATRKSVRTSVVETAAEEAPAEEGEPSMEEPVEAAPYVPVHAPKNPLLFPPRGPGRPHLRQVLSEPDLKRRFLALPAENQDYQADKLAAPTADYHQGVKSHDDYRQGLQSLLRGLEVQSAKKKERERRRDVTEQSANEMRRAHQLFLEGSRVGKQRAAWTYTDHADFMEKPQLYEQGESKTCSRNQLLTGIFDVAHPDFRPPHHENNVYGGWSYFQTNLRNEQLYEFRDKEWQKTPMSPGELMFKDRLEQSIERMTRETHQDALNNTTGYVKKQRVNDAAGEHSCLKRGKKPWADQQVSTHTFFQTYPPYKPGDHMYETGLPKYIVEPDRTFNYQRNVIVGDELQKSFWKYPKQALSGTNRRQTMAQELIHQNNRGAAGLKPPSPIMKRKVLLKGTGSLSFTHLKDALVQPTYERFSPTDRSEPP